MKAIKITELKAEQLAELANLYRTTRDVRLRTRAQMVLLAAEQHVTASAIVPIVRESEETVRRWLKRYQAEGIDGLRDQHRGGAPAKVTDAYREQLLSAVRRHPRSLGQPYSLWTLQRLADYLAAGKVNKYHLEFEPSEWMALAKKHGSPGFGSEVTKPGKTKGYFGLGDLIYFAVRFATRFMVQKRRQKLARCQPCQARRKSWNRWRIRWR